LTSTSGRNQLEPNSPGIDRTVKELTIVRRRQDGHTVGSLYPIEKNTEPHGQSSALVGYVSGRRLIGIAVASAALLAGTCPAQLSAPRTFPPNAPAAGRRKSPAITGDELTPEEYKRLAEAMNRLSPKERKRLAEAVKGLSPEGRRQLAQVVKRQLAGKATGAQVIKRGR
jgi:hypothetical protein